MKKIAWDSLAIHGRQMKVERSSGFSLDEKPTSLNCMIRSSIKLGVGGVRGCVDAERLAVDELSNAVRRMTRNASVMQPSFGAVHDKDRHSSQPSHGNPDSGNCEWRIARI